MYSVLQNTYEIIRVDNYGFCIYGSGTWYHTSPCAATGWQVYQAAGTYHTAVTGTRKFSDLCRNPCPAGTRSLSLHATRKAVEALKACKPVGDRAGGVHSARLPKS